MERLTCGIIQDLILSYYDGLTGENVNQMMREHLTECQECRKRYEEVRGQREAEESREISKGKRFEEKIKSIRYYVIGILMGLVLPIVFIVIWYAICAIGSYFETMFYSYFL